MKDLNENIKYKLDIIGTWEYKHDDDIEYITVDSDGYGEYIKMDNKCMLYRNKIYSNVSYIDVDTFQFEYHLLNNQLHIGDKVYNKIDKVFQDIETEGYPDDEPNADR